MRLRRRRKVRLHIEGMQGSLQGILVGMWAGHYVLDIPEVIVGEGAGTTSLQGDGFRRVAVPKGRVLFLQEG